MAKTLQEKIAVMQAFAEGKKIQFQIALQEEWLDTDQPTWDWWARDYRIVPERPIEKAYRIYHIAAYPESSFSGKPLERILVGLEAVLDAANRGEFKCESQ
jgi:hypothetical protein